MVTKEVSLSLFGKTPGDSLRTLGDSSGPPPPLTPQFAQPQLAQTAQPLPVNTFTMSYDLAVTLDTRSLRVLDIVLTNADKSVHMPPKYPPKTYKCVMFPASKGRPTLVKIEGPFGKYESNLTLEGEVLLGELKKIS